MSWLFASGHASFMRFVAGWSQLLFGQKSYVEYISVWLCMSMRLLSTDIIKLPTLAYMCVYTMYWFLESNQSSDSDSDYYGVVLECDLFLAKNMCIVLVFAMIGNDNNYEGSICISFLSRYFLFQ